MSDVIGDGIVFSTGAILEYFINLAKIWHMNEYVVVCTC